MAVKMTKTSYALLIIIIAMLLYVFCFIPIAENFKRMQRDIEGLNIQFIKNVRTISDFDVLYKRYQEYKDVVKQTRSDEEEMAFFIKEIQAYTQELSLSIKDIKPMSKVGSAGVNIFSVDVNIEGSIKDLVLLLHKIASEKKLIKVEKMSLEVARSSDSTTLSASFGFSKNFIS